MTHPKKIAPRFTPHTVVPALRRLKMRLEYDGTPYHGWQSQKTPSVPTIETALTTAFEALTHSLPEGLVAAGRTDKGVHAQGMVCHLDTFHPIEAERIKTGLNRFLPSTIAVLDATEVDQNFHARFLCSGRAYEYRLVNRYSPSPLHQNRAALVRHPLNIAHMREAAAYLLGTHDFSAFRSSECQAKNPITTLRQLDICTEGDLISIHLEGVTFLHNMVRIIAGLLVDVGLGRLPTKAPLHAFNHKDRTQLGCTMPACGLFFKEAFYPETS